MGFRERIRAALQRLYLLISDADTTVYKRPSSRDYKKKLEENSRSI